MKERANIIMILPVIHGFNLRGKLQEAGYYRFACHSYEDEEYPAFELTATSHMRISF